jgi:hypothetical protein
MNQLKFYVQTSQNCQGSHDSHTMPQHCCHLQQKSSPHCKSPGMILAEGTRDLESKPMSKQLVSL